MDTHLNDKVVKRFGVNKYILVKKLLTTNFEDVVGYYIGELFARHALAA